MFTASVPAVGVATSVSLSPPKLTVPSKPLSVNAPDVAATVASVNSKSSIFKVPDWVSIFPFASTISALPPFSLPIGALKIWV